MESITVTFEGKFLSWLNSGAWSSSAAGAKMDGPTLGAELFTNSGFDSDTAWTKGSGWAIGSGVATHTPGASSALYQLNAFPAGSWVRMDWDLVVRASRLYPYFGSANFNTERLASGSYVDTKRAAAGVCGFFTFASTFDGDVDNAIAKAIPTTDLVNVIQYTGQDVKMLAYWDSQYAGTQYGVIWLDDYSDPQNGIVAYCDGYKAYIDKLVSGTWSQVLSPVTITPGSYLGADIYEDSGAIKVQFYNETSTVGTLQSISDASIVAITTPQIGLFSTYEGNVCSRFKVTDTSDVLIIDHSFNTASLDYSDISADVLDGWDLDTGFRSIRPDKLIADIGVLSFDLKNGINNSVALNGYYSPGHANQRYGFKKRTPIRVKTVYGGTTQYYKFYIKSIKPLPGQYDTRRTQVICQDIFADLNRKNVGLLGVQTNVRSDELFDLIIADMVTPPDNTSFATGPEAFASAFTDLQSERMKLLAVCNHVLHSDWSRMWNAPDTTDGETLTTVTRSAGSGASEVTITDTMMDVDSILTLDNLVSRVNVTAYPNAVDADQETIYTHPTELYVGPGETKDFYAKFTDNQTGERICAASVVDPLVATTHYKASSQSEDGGNDMIAFINIDISATGEPVGADQAHVYVTNSNTTYALYLNYFIMKGSPIRRRDTYEVEAESPNISADGVENTLTVKMPYTSDVNLADAIARKLIDDWGNEDNVRAYKVTFNTNRDATMADLAFNKPLGTKITIQETQSGLNHDSIILGKSIGDMGAGVYECRLVLDPAYGIAGWLLGVTDFSELGVAGVTVLGL